MPSLWKNLLCLQEVYCQHVGKKVHEIERDESDEPFDQRDYDFYWDYIQNLVHVKQIEE